jgi:hypothetical protein
LEELHRKHEVQRGIWVPTQHLLWDQGKPRKTLIELAGRRTFRMHTDCQSQSYITSDSQSVSPSCVRYPSGTRDQFFFLLEIFFRQLRVCCFVSQSLTRGRVCNLLLLLVLARAVRGTQDHILLSQFSRLPQPGGPGLRIYIPQEQGVPRENTASHNPRVTAWSHCQLKLPQPGGPGPGIYIARNRVAQEKTPLPPIPVSHNDVTISAAPPFPMAPPVCYVVWCEVFQCCVAVHCALTPITGISSD